MKQQTKQIIAVIVLLLVTLTMAACGRKSEEVKVEQTMDAFMTGYSSNNSSQMMSVVLIDDSKKEDFQQALDQFLQALHQENYSVQLDYSIENVLVIENSAEVKLSAVVRIFENGQELLSFRLLNQQVVYLTKDANGNWKIDFKKYLPEDLLKISLF